MTFSIEGSGASEVDVIRSADHGLTWTAPVRVGMLNQPQPSDPVHQQVLGQGNVQPDIAVDPRSGRAYVVWADSSAAASGEFVLAFVMTQLVPGNISSVYFAAARP